MKNNLGKGFTLIELLVVVAIIGMLAVIIMVASSTSRGKGSDSKIKAQVGQMNGQTYLFRGTLGTAYVVPTPYQVSAGVTGAAAGGTPATGTLFNDTTTGNNSLYQLISKLPSNTYVYYGWNGTDLNTTGRWFFAASLAGGAFCNDWRSEKKTSAAGASPTTLANFLAYFPNASAAGGYLCN